jgi:hypothetical protein
MLSVGLNRKYKFAYKFFSEIKKITTSNKYKERNLKDEGMKIDIKNDFSNYIKISKNNQIENEKSNIIVDSEHSNSAKLDQQNINIQEEIKFQLESKSKRNLDKIIKEEEEESAREKYIEFTKILKTQDAIRRKEDIEISKVLKNPILSYVSLRSVLMQRNFLKKKNFENDSEEKIKSGNNMKKFEINLKNLEKFNFNFKEPITLYELDVESIEIFRKSRPLFKTYFFLSVLSNLVFTFSFEALFTYTKYFYATCYISNSITLVTYIIAKKIKNRILTLEYLHDEKSLKIRKWKSIWGGNSIEEIKIRIEDLEMVYSNKLLEQGVSLRYRNDIYKHFWIGVAEEGLWHNIELFENLFGKIKAYEA